MSFAAVMQCSKLSFSVTQLSFSVTKCYAGSVGVFMQNWSLFSRGKVALSRKVTPFLESFFIRIYMREVVPARQANNWTLPVSPMLCVCRFLTPSLDISKEMYDSSLAWGCSVWRVTLILFKSRITSPYKQALIHIIP